MAARRFVLSFVLVFVLAGSALAGAVAGGGAVYLAVRQDLQAAQPVAQAAGGGEANPAPVNQTVNVDVNTAIEEAVAKVGPAVVTVLNNLDYGGQASGSGVFISADGYAVTNNHVVDGARSLEVIYQDGSRAAARLVGTDPFADIAVLKVDGDVPAYAEFGNSDALNPGETVIAIGSPLGDFRNTVTVGVVSATGRSLDRDANFQMEGLIQTDAAINNGNSGGPLVNLAGQVVGINTLVVRGNAYSYNQAEGLGFAVAANIVKAVADQLIERGFVARPWLGISSEPVTPEVARAYGLPVEWGVYITRVEPGSPAAAAGLQEGDIVTHIGGTAIDADNPFINTLWQNAVGDTVEITVNRSGTTLTVPLTLGERPR